MSLFSLGGNAGFALGPALVTPAVALLGLRGALVITVPAALVALWVAVELPRLSRFRPARPVAGAGGAGRAAADDDWSAFGRLGVVIAARTFLFWDADLRPAVLRRRAAPLGGDGQLRSRRVPGRRRGRHAASVAGWRTGSADGPW